MPFSFESSHHRPPRYPGWPGPNSVWPSTKSWNASFHWQRVFDDERVVVQPLARHVDHAWCAIGRIVRTIPPSVATRPALVLVMPTVDGEARVEGAVGWPEQPSAVPRTAEHRIPESMVRMCIVLTSSVCALWCEKRLWSTVRVAPIPDSRCFVAGEAKIPLRGKENAVAALLG